MKGLLLAQLTPVGGPFTTIAETEWSQSSVVGMVTPG
jgi:hypothetical protein